MAGVSHTVGGDKRTPEEVAENLIYPEKAKAEKEANLKADVIVLKPPEAQNIHRTAGLESTEKEAVEVIMEDAWKRDSDDKRPWAAVMDGASGLWHSTAEMFSGTDYTGVRDIIHVVEYLWVAGDALNGENTPETDKQVCKRLLSILPGDVGRVTGGL